MCSTGYPFSLALQTTLHLPGLPTYRNRKGSSLEVVPTVEWVLHVQQSISAFRGSTDRDCFKALTTTFCLFFPSLLQVSMGDHGQWIRGNFSFNGKYPEFSSLKGRRGLTLLQCPPVPALSRPREGSALGRAVGAAGRTDGRMDAGPPRAGRWCWGSTHPGAAPRPCCHQQQARTPGGQFQPARARWSRAEPCGNEGITPS